MNNPNQNNYIQYVTRLDVVKTKAVIFTDNGINTTFKVEGIIEEFFILAVFQNNLRILGVGFDDIENNDMLGFLNSESQDLSLIPKNAFLNSEQIVTMSYNNAYLKNLANNIPIVPAVGVGASVAKYQYDPFRYFIDLNAGNLEIEGFSISHINQGLFFKREGVYTDIDGSRVYQNDIIQFDFNAATGFGIGTDLDNFYFDFLGFTLKAPIAALRGASASGFAFDFLVDRKYNIFDLVPRVGSTDTIQYAGQFKNIHIWNVMGYTGADFMVQVIYRMQTSDFI